MPFALIAIGILLIVAGIRNTQNQLGSLVASDFTGAGSFLYWAVAIIGIGIVGYAKDFKGLSGSFMALVIIALLVSNKGFFAQFQSALKQSANQSITATNEAVPSPTLNVHLLGGSSSSSSGPSAISTGLTVASALAGG